MRTIEQQRTEWPLAGHRGWCHKVQVAQSEGHLRGKCDCGEVKPLVSPKADKPLQQLRQNLETLN